MRLNKKINGLKMQTISISIIMLTGVVLAFGSFAQAENPIQPDRPGFGTGTYTIDPGTIYLELGYEYNFSTQNVKPNYHVAPQANLRFGLLPNFEMNVTWQGLEATNNIKVTDELGLGAKYRVIKADDYNISLLGKFDFSDFANDINITPLLGLLWDYELSPNLEAFGVVQLGYESGPVIFIEFSLGLALPLGDKAGLYGEYYIEFTPKQSDLSHNADIGITYHITHDIQVDAFFATGLTSDAFRHVGFGFAKRF